MTCLNTASSRTRNKTRGSLSTFSLSQYIGCFTEAQHQQMIKTRPHECECYLLISLKILYIPIYIIYKLSYVSCVIYVCNICGLLFAFLKTEVLLCLAIVTHGNGFTTTLNMCFTNYISTYFNLLSSQEE